MYIYSHNRYSEGANLLRKALGLRSLHRAIERKRKLFLTPIINWGAHSIPANTGRYINVPDKVETASNKLLTFQALKAAGVSIPEFTTDRAVAQGWVNEGHTVVCRTILNGSEGRGIIMWNRENALAENVRVPLFVKYVKKKHEYRIHVGKSPDGGYGVLCVQQKRRQRGFEDRDNQIRNHDNGWIFAVNDIIPPHSSVMSEAIKAVMALGLDFGAVDVVFNERQKKAYVLEVNTAPGLEPNGTALAAYVGYFRRYM